MDWMMLVYILVAGVGGSVGSSWYCRTILRPRWEREAAKRALKEWYPPADMGDKLFVSAEEVEALRRRRELHDSGRVYPPRSDAGPSGRSHRARVRIKPSTTHKPF